MLPFQILAIILAAIGCAKVSSTTVSSTDPKTGIRNERTTMRVFTVFDANSSLAKAANQSSMSGPTNAPYAPGTHLSGLNQSSTSSNVANIVNAAVAGAVQGAVQAAK